MNIRDLFIWIIIATVTNAAIVMAQDGTTPVRVPVPKSTPVVRTPNLLADGMGPRDNNSTTAMSPADVANYKALMSERYLDPIYRKPTRSELEAVAVDVHILRKYEPFLSLPNTGIFKLIRDHGCDQQTSIVSADEICRRYSMPGAGNSYSFRSETYRVRRIGDISMGDYSIYSSGVLMHGILTKLGDVSIEEIKIDSVAVAGLIDIVPTVSTKDAIEFGHLLEKGISKNGYLYSHSVPLLVNTTYLLRSIAYRGKSMRAVVGVTYNEMDHDKRRDILVAFRVVDIDAKGSATIIWRQLRNIESPKIKE